MAEDPIFGATWVFLYCPVGEIVETAKGLKGLTRDEKAGFLDKIRDGFANLPEFIGGRTIWDGAGSGSWIVVWASPASDCLPATVAHECFHGTAVVLAAKGLSLADASDEAYAYYMSWAIKSWYRGVGGEE